MKQLIATIIYVAGIAGLFYLDREPKARTSKVLWIPLVWLLIIGSRPVSFWLPRWLNPAAGMTQQQLYQEGSPIDAAVFAVLLVAGIVVLSKRSKQVGRILRGNLPLILFFAYCGLSVVWSDFPFVALKRWIKAIGDPVMVLVVFTELDTVAALRQIFSRAAFVLLPLSVLFIKYYPTIGRNLTKSWTMAFGGITMGKNELGQICLVLGLGALWTFLSVYRNRALPNRVRHLVAHGTILATVIWIFKTSNSMTSFSCFLLAGAVMFMTTRRYFFKHPHAVHALVGGCVALALFALFLDESGVLVHALGRNKTLTGRTEIWHAVLAVQTNPLLGAGFESFWMGDRIQHVWALLNNDTDIQEAHNGYIELYVQLGAVGLVLLATLILTGYRNAFAVFRRDPNLGRLRLAFFTAALIYSLTEAGFHVLSPIWFAFLLAVTFTPQKVQFRKHQPATESPFEQSPDDLLEGHVIEESPQLALRLQSTH